MTPDDGDGDDDTDDDDSNGAAYGDAGNDTGWYHLCHCHRRRSHVGDC